MLLPRGFRRSRPGVSLGLSLNMHAVFLFFSFLCQKGTAVIKFDGANVTQLINYKPGGVGWNVRSSANSRTLRGPSIISSNSRNWLDQLIKGRGITGGVGVGGVMDRGWGWGPTWLKCRGQRLQRSRGTQKVFIGGAALVGPLLPCYEQPLLKVPVRVCTRARRVHQASLPLEVVWPWNRWGLSGAKVPIINLWQNLHRWPEGHCFIKCLPLWFSQPSLLSASKSGNGLIYANASTFPTAAVIDGRR